MYEIKLYFSYRDDKQLIEILDFIEVGFDAFTYYRVNGYYKGTYENSIILELITDNSFKTKAKILNIIGFIKNVGLQETVLYTIKEVEAKLL